MLLQPKPIWRGIRAVSQLLWTEKDREVWFSLGENHEKACRFGLHQLLNCSSHGAVLFRDQRTAIAQTLFGFIC
jgi:hypothetical protein